MQVDREWNANVNLLLKTARTGYLLVASIYVGWTPILQLLQVETGDGADGLTFSRGDPEKDPCEYA